MDAISASIRLCFLSRPLGHTIRQTLRDIAHALSSILSMKGVLKTCLSGNTIKTSMYVYVNSNVERIDAQHNINREKIEQ